MISRYDGLIHIDELRTYNLPVGAHFVVKDGQKISTGDLIIKIPRAVGSSGDITGGLPRVTELFEARNPSNPAVVSEIDGEVTFGKIKRGNREIVVTAKSGEVKKYLVSLSKQILVQENDFVRSGTPLSDGAITPLDILHIKGPTAVQEYIVTSASLKYVMLNLLPLIKCYKVLPVQPFKLRVSCQLLPSRKQRVSLTKPPSRVKKIS